MSPYRDEFIDYETFASGIEVTIANGKKLALPERVK